MRTKTIVALCTILLVVGTAFAGGDANKAEKKAYNYSDTFVGPIAEGTTAISGKMIHLRGVQNSWIIAASDERISGTTTSVMNANLDSTGTGLIWGTFQISNDDGAWEGTYTGQMYNYFAGGLNWIIRIVAHGTGAYEGLKIEASEAWDSLQDYSLWPWSGYGAGEITDNGKGVTGG
jgi:hypothetical protein